MLEAWPQTLPGNFFTFHSGDFSFPDPYYLTPDPNSDFLNQENLRAHFISLFVPSLEVSWMEPPEKVPESILLMVKHKTDQNIETVLASDSAFSSQ